MLPIVVLLFVVLLVVLLLILALQVRRLWCCLPSYSTAAGCGVAGHSAAGYGTACWLWKCQLENGASVGIQYCTNEIFSYREISFITSDCCTFDDWIHTQGNSAKSRT